MSQHLLDGHVEALAVDLRPARLHVRLGDILEEGAAGRLCLQGAAVEIKGGV